MEHATLAEASTPVREIPFNYTSAGDRQVVAMLLGPDLVETLEALRDRRVTGRSARLLMRFLGDLQIHRRNPYLFQELLDSAGRRERFFENTCKELAIVEAHAGGDPLVFRVLDACRELLAGFRAEVDSAPGLRRRLKRDLGAVIGARNVLFDPFALVAHATDATDWRLALPVAVAMPETAEQVAPLLAAIGRMGLKAIPRGAGTGLTGGAVPLERGCVIINTEQLNRIQGIRQQTFQLALSLDSLDFNQSHADLSGRENTIFAATKVGVAPPQSGFQENSAEKHSLIFEAPHLHLPKGLLLYLDSRLLKSDKQ